MNSDGHLAWSYRSVTKVWIKLTRLRCLFITVLKQLPIHQGVINDKMSMLFVLSRILETLKPMQTLEKSRHHLKCIIVYISLMYFHFCSLHDGPNGCCIHPLIHACLACVRHKKCNQQPHIQYNLYMNQKYTNLGLLVVLMKAVKGVTRGYWHVSLLSKVNRSKTDSRSQMKPSHKHETIKNLLCARYDK